MYKYLYIIYKILNNLLFRFRFNRNYKCGEVLIDINHHTTHLGDRIFLLDLINSLSKSSRKPNLRKSDHLSISLFNALDLPVGNLERSDCQFISLKPMYLNLFFKQLINYYSFIDNSDYTGPLSKEIAKDYCDKLGVQYQEYTVEETPANGEKYVLFNNNIDSGWFRKFFCNETQLYEKCIQFKNEGFTIVHIGSANDKSSDLREYAFVDDDWRGKTSIMDVIKMFKEGRVHAVVTYDNFFLHLANLFAVPVFVLFRGRFTRKAKEFHYQTVNVALLRATSRMEYLNKS